METVLQLLICKKIGYMLILMIFSTHSSLHEELIIYSLTIIDKVIFSSVKSYLTDD